jgi:dipeptidase E
MSQQQLLLHSSSRVGSQPYLAHLLPSIACLATGREKAVFIPFAGVLSEYREYTDKVRASFASIGVSIDALDPSLPREALVSSLRSADLIVVGGGNTFRLLATCRKLGLTHAICESVANGAAYVGWSAGANLACPTICTTNDMPIVDPGGFEALNLVDFQINPHYTTESLPGHHGESRDTRIAEYLALNPRRFVVGLPEGSWLQVENAKCVFHGTRPAVVFRLGMPSSLLEPGEKLEISR